MYSDRQKKKWKSVLIAALAAVCVFLIAFFIYKSPASGKDGDAAKAIQLAVQQSALQCYTVEGAYPPNLEYLEENYGLQINTRDFYVVYDAFASNLPPDIRVRAK